MLRVLFYQFFPGGGIGRYTHLLASELNRHSEVDVELVCSPEYHHLAEADYRVWSGLAPIGAKNPLVRKAKFLMGQWRNPRRFVGYLRDQECDVVHFSNINHLTYRFWRNQIHRPSHKVVATVHDVRRAGKILNRRWESRWLRCFYEDADALFVHSEKQLSDLLEYAPGASGRIHKVPHGVYAYPPSNSDRHAMRAKWGIAPDRTVGLHFGMIRADKNLPALLEALSMLRVNRPFLVIAGRMAERGQESESVFRSLIESLQLTQDVLIVNRFIDENEVGDLYQLADFGCLTYRSDFTSQSGVLNVAAHFDLPVLVTPAPTLAETVEEYRIGRVCAGDTAEAIASELRKLSSTLSRSGEFDFERYRREQSWQTNARRTLAVYQQLSAG